MEQKIIQLQNKGMTRDISISKQNNEFAYENFNIRITPRDHDTLLTVTNERGNSKITVFDEDSAEANQGFEFPEVLLGYGVLNEYLILFFTTTKNLKRDFIYRIRYDNKENKWYSKLLYEGNLNFDYIHPIETITYYESEQIQKIYWTDGYNQPRMMNFAAAEKIIENNNTQFDFITTYKFPESGDISITKQFYGVANFSPGTIQYFFTYSKKYGQETNIIYQSPLYYMSDEDKANTADSLCSCSFEIRGVNLDTDFDYLNIYSVIKTSESGTPSVYKVTSAEISSEIVYVDNGTYSENGSIDPTLLLYIGGREITAGTFSHKDNTLFLGNITIQHITEESIQEIIDQLNIINDKGESNIVEFEYNQDYSIDYPEPVGIYPYLNQLNSNSYNIQVYKGGEKYRFAIQFISNTGARSSAFWVGDKTNYLYPKIENNKVIKAVPVCKLPTALVNAAVDAGYTGVTLLRAVASDSDKSVVAQGVLCPTVFNVRQRVSDAPFGMASWFFRPKNNNKIIYEHFKAIPHNSSFSSEIQCSNRTDPFTALDTEEKGEGQFVTEEKEFSLTPYCEYSDYFCIGVKYKFQASTATRWGGMKVYITRILINGDPVTDNFPTYEESVGNRSATKCSHIVLNRIMRDMKADGVPGAAPTDELGDEDDPSAWVNQIWAAWEVWHSGSHSDRTYYWFYTSDEMPFGGLTSDFGWNHGLRLANTFFVDESLVTLDSPDFSDSTMLNEQLEFRVIGAVKISANKTNYYFDIEQSADSTYETAPYQFSSLNITSKPEEYPTFPWISTVATSSIVENEEDKETSTATRYFGNLAFMIYPWHKTGYIVPEDPVYKMNEETGQQELDPDSPVSRLKLNSKILGTLRYAYNTSYLWTADENTPESVKTANKLYNYWKVPGGTYMEYIKKDSDTTTINISDSERKMYYASCDFILSPKVDDSISSEDSEESTEIVGSEKYSIYNTGSMGFTYDKAKIEALTNEGLKSEVESTKLVEYYKTYDPVNIAYRSCGHALISFKPEDKYTYVLPDIIETDSTAEDTIIIEENNSALPWKKYNSEVADKIKVALMPQLSTSNYSLPIYPATVIALPQQYPTTDGTLYLNLTNEEKAEFKNSYEECLKYMEEFEGNPDFHNSVFIVTSYEGTNVLWTIKNDIGIRDNITTVNAVISYIKEINAGTQEEQIKTTVSVSGNDITNCKIVLYEAIGEGTYTEKETQFTQAETEVQFEIAYSEQSLSSYKIGVSVLLKDNEYSEEYQTSPVYANTITETATQQTISEEVDLGGLFITIPYWNISNEFEYGITPTQKIYKFTYSQGSNILSGIEEQYLLGVYYKRALLPDVVPLGLSGSTSNNVTQSSYLLIGEIYRDFSKMAVDPRYGGIEHNALESNVFIPCGGAYKLTKNIDVTVYGPEGDSYFQRYDILKTYPYAENKENSIIEVLSCMLESRINLDGRTDNQRSLPDYTLVQENSFNTINSSYTQQDNFITNAVLDEKYNLNYFPTQITWTKTKIPTEEVDTWTNITLVSTLDMDGDKGDVQAIRRYRNSLIAFQDKGIAEILYNTRTQLGTTQGVPIEIANSGKVDGKRYITDKAGCKNKWSIIETDRGIYFIDNINSSISILGQDFQSLSDSKGFKTWIGNENNLNIWNPVDFSNFSAYWDRVNDDVYFLKGTLSDNHNTLCYNELIQQFTSFYDYGQVPMMVNVEDKFISFKNNQLWEQGVGKYNEIFGEYQNYHVLYRVTPDPYGDKIFNNIEYRADVFKDNTDELLPEETFDTLEVWNEYQGNKVSVKDSSSPLYSFSAKDLYPDIRRKFRIWRMDIPRDRKGIDNPYGLNRIRNPWIYLKLEKDNSIETEDTINNRMELHNILIRYMQ